LHRGQNRPGAFRFMAYPPAGAWRVGEGNENGAPAAGEGAMGPASLYPAKDVPGRRVSALGKPTGSDSRRPAVLNTLLGGRRQGRPAVGAKRRRGYGWLPSAGAQLLHGRCLSAVRGDATLADTNPPPSPPG
jgi:hypothetical protein